MLNGIDISSHQGDIDLSALEGVDFIVVKATEGTGYVNPWCDPKVQWCIDNGKLWGVYMWLKPGISATEQADYFVDNCANYFGHGIPVIDWEEGERDPGRVSECARRIRERTGVWPMIYSWPRWFTPGGVEPNCGRWVCSYPDVEHPGFDFEGDSPEADTFVAMWQYASDGRIGGYDGNLDLNHFYGGASAWLAYAGATPHEPAPEPEQTPEPAPEPPAEGEVHHVKPGDTIVLDK